MDKKDNSIFPMVKFAWASPIRPQNPNGYFEPFVVYHDFPDPPESNAVYTFMDESGNVVPRPSETSNYLPPYCYVQYVEEFPPSPPSGYQYVWSELQKDPCSQIYHLYHEIGNPRYGIDTPNLSGYMLYELTKPERSGMVSDLIEHPDGYFSPGHGVLISNFTIKMHRLIREYGMNGPISEKLEFSVHAGGRDYLSREVCDVEALDKLPEQIRSKVPGCIVNIHVSKVDAQIVFHLRSSLLHIPRAEKYTCSGWNRINGVWYYAQDRVDSNTSDIVFETGFKIVANPALNARDAMFSAMGMLSVSSQTSVIVPLILFAHLGVLFTLFEQAGFAPRMLLFINGKTGSLKTAVCSVLYNLSGEIKRNIPATFRDSVASVEAKFPEYVDKVLLLDDYSPATTARNSADMNKLLEDIIRYFGDGKGKGRSNVTVTKSVSPIPRGLCCITGEDTGGGSQSSLLRCLLIDVSNGVFDGERLAPYQSDPRLWTTHFHHFVQYISGRFNELKEMIKDYFPMLRGELRRSLSAGRIIDSAAYLYLTAKIVLDYGIYAGWTSASEADSLLSVWGVAIVDALKKSEDTSAELDPVKFYLSTMFEAVDSGVEFIAPDKERFVLNPSVLGYESKGFWHIWPDRVYALAQKRSQLMRRRFPLSMAKLNAALADAHLIKISTEKRGDKEQTNYLQRESFGERPRMLVIDKDAAQRYLEN